MSSAEVTDIESASPVTEAKLMRETRCALAKCIRDSAAAFSAVNVGAVLQIAQAINQLRES